ncbi:MAG: ABC transporter permease [Bacteroidales bacterium]|nr:ABC transporter permease [Bacteroidales bacterium]
MINWHIIGVVIGREYKTRVKKKSFLLTTFLVPILFAALCIVPSLIMIFAEDKGKTVAVVDESGIVMPFMESNEAFTFKDYSSEEDLSILKANINDLELDAVLHVFPLDEASKSVSVEAFSLKPISMDLKEAISKRVDDAMEDYRINSYEIAGLKQMMEDVKYNTDVKTYVIDDSGEEKISSSEVMMIISMLFSMIIYLFITMFCGMVMQSVIEEKSSRVVEVLVSSVKATELMIGKIVGVACVALTQFLLWILLTGAIVGIAMPLIGADKLAAASAPEELVQMSGVDVDMEAITAAAADGESEGLAAIIETVKGINFTQIIVAFLLFFALGYLLYASLFAAIGSAVDNEADTQQLQLPVTIPLLLGFFVALYAFKAPDSALVWWCSMIPFTSPIVMLARIPLGVATWEIALSLVLLVLTFFGCAWASAKIYKVGILMFGKKSTFADLWKWLKQK